MTHPNRGRSFLPPLRSRVLSFAGSNRTSAWLAFVAITGLGLAGGWLILRQIAGSRKRRAHLRVVPPVDSPSDPALEKPPEQNQPIEKSFGERRFGGNTRDEIEQASWESFPASDPPAW